MGICLGMQLLFDESSEFENCKGLGIIRGKIRKFPKELDNNKIRVPHVSWAKINRNQDNAWDKSVMHDLSDGDFMYFVHSFYAVPDYEENILSLTEYSGIKYCSAVIKGNNVFATQFHPEKSGKKGLSIYKNWGITNQLL